MATKRQGRIAFTGAEWTKDGEFFGRIRVPRGANDVHWESTSQSRRPKVTFTKNGEPMGPPIVPPPAANDVRFIWNGRGCLPILIFTKDGHIIGHPEVPPPGANDLHLAWQGGVITSAEWTLDGEPIAEIDVPDGANDAHFFLLRER